MQRLQNWAARTIFTCNRYTHALPLLYKLHWFPIRYRIMFKILVTVFTARQHQSPIFISELFEFQIRVNNVRIINMNKLQVPVVRTANASRSLSVIGPKYWNALPHDIRCITSREVFKCRVKTYLFGIAFSAFS